jgi:hypothetical protein
LILWTIQTLGALRTLEKAGVLRADVHVACADWLPAYRWMIDQMTKRVGPPPSRHTMPLWAWCQWLDARHAKPDLRARGHVSRAERAVRIEFEIAEDRVLLSDFDLWHHVLNHWYIPASQRDDRRFDADLARWSDNPAAPHRLQRHPNIRNQIQKSWTRIFDLAWRNRYAGAHPRRDRAIQATLWELRLDMVRDTTPFIGR